MRWTQPADHVGKRTLTLAGSRISLGGLLLSLALIGIGDAAPGVEPAVIEMGGRRELFVDDFLVDRRDGLELRLQTPVPRQVVLVHDAPWEGSGCGYHTIFRDGNVVRMYYIAADLTSADGSKMASHPAFACYAESRDGIHWTKPELGLFAFAGSKRNNIVWASPGLDNFTPFQDTNADGRPDERYKAVSAGSGGLHAYKSADGIRWSPLVERPIITKGAFDTQNNAFWDPLRKQYWCYVRDFHDGIRDIRVATSTDFHTWTEPRRLVFPDSPDEPLYTNQVRPYDRAPHIFLGFPTRYIERPWAPTFEVLPDPTHRKARMKFHPRFGTAVTDGQFMSSRDGRTFQRWDETFLRPGPERRDNWLYGDGYQSLGLLETAAEDPTAPRELSIYVGENHWKGAIRLRRHTLRIDGFIALHARRKPGELVTRPFIFRGKSLSLNFATSAAGNLHVEIDDSAGHPLPGFALADCDELFGDSLDRTVTWKGISDLGPLAGKRVRLRVVMTDADLFSFQFTDPLAPARGGPGGSGARRSRGDSR